MFGPDGGPVRLESRFNDHDGNMLIHPGRLTAEQYRKHYRYWDKNGDPLPAGVATDDNGDPVPPYAIDDRELNDIRQIDVGVITRSGKEDPNSSLNIGDYLPGSAATRGGTTSYSDRYHRATFKAVTFPRNSATAPWGKINMTANPAPIGCPDNTSTITAPAKVPLTRPPVQQSGRETPPTVLTYDWEQPSVTATVSASALIRVDGEDRPVFNAIPVSFGPGDGIFTDDFDDNNSDG